MKTIPIKDAASKSYPLTPDIAKAPTNGPFKYENASSDTIVLVRNDNWKAGDHPAYLDKVTFKYYPDNKEGLIAAFLNGETDVALDLVQTDYDAIKGVDPSRRASAPRAGLAVRAPRPQPGRQGPGPRPSGAPGPDRPQGDGAGDRPDGDVPDRLPRIAGRRPTRSARTRSRRNYWRIPDDKADVRPVRRRGGEHGPRRRRLHHADARRRPDRSDVEAAARLRALHLEHRLPPDSAATSWPSRWKTIGIKLNLNFVDSTTILFANWPDVSADTKCNTYHGTYDTAEFGYSLTFDLFGNYYYGYHSEQIPTDANKGNGYNTVRFNDPEMDAALDVLKARPQAGRPGPGRLQGPGAVRRRTTSRSRSTTGTRSAGTRPRSRTCSGTRRRRPSSGTSRTGSWPRELTAPRAPILPHRRAAERPTCGSRRAPVRRRRSLPERRRRSCVLGRVVHHRAVRTERIRRGRRGAGIDLVVDRWRPDVSEPGASTFVLVHGLASNARLWDGVAGAADRARAPGRDGRPARPRPLVQARRRLRRPDRRRRPRRGSSTRLGLDRPVVAGQSWGGNVVLELAAARTRTAIRGIACVDGGWLEPAAQLPRLGGVPRALAPPRLVGRPLTEIEGYVRSSHADWPETGIPGTLANFEVRPDGTIAPWLTYERHLARPARPVGPPAVRALRRGRGPGPAHPGRQRPTAIAPDAQAAVESRRPPAPSLGPGPLVRRRPRHPRPASGRAGATCSTPASTDGFLGVSGPARSWRSWARARSRRRWPRSIGRCSSGSGRRGRVPAALIDTPYGFQENADELTRPDRRLLRDERRAAR